VTRTVAFVFPGQGSQHIGMGKALADAYPPARAILASAEAAFAQAGSDGGASLTSMIFDGPDEQLTLTEHAQPAIFAVSLAAHAVLAAHGVVPAFMAGHSLGEYSAHAAAGTFTFADGIRILRRRGRYMQEAVPVGVGAMAAFSGSITRQRSRSPKKQPKARSARRPTIMAAARWWCPATRPPLSVRSRSRKPTGQNGPCCCRCRRRFIAA
jgi:malonyl CoA-acyl carrier protein transacylase